MNIKRNMLKKELNEKIKSLLSELEISKNLLKRASKGRLSLIQKYDFLNLMKMKKDSEKENLNEK